MKKILLTGILALAVSMIFVSCKKDPQEKEEKGIAIEVTDITATTATINVSCKGATPTLVRLTSVADTETVELNVEDQQAVAKYATDNGEAISLPYSTKAEGLEGAVEYVVAAVAYDASMQLISAKAVKFITAAPDNAIGDESGAGEITARTL